VRIPDEVVRAMGAPPTEEQWAAISMPLEPFALVAGAGSGKTSVMAARVVYLALVALGRVEADHGGALPGNVLCLTFTNKATENLVLRVRRALATLDLPEGEEPAIDNYHGFATQVLDRWGLLAGIEPGQRVLTQAQRVELCGRVLDRMAFDVVPTEWQPTVVSKILDLDEQAQNHRVPLERIVEFNEGRLEELEAHRSDKAFRASQERIELARACMVYRELKRELGVIDFGDQIELALEIVERNPEVARRYRERFDAVLLDEYQDTNVAQARLMQGIFGNGHPVTAVGDPDQNIYAWRGASLYNLIEFPRQFPRADGSEAKRLPLYTNFRSGARILHAADTLLADVPIEQRPDPDKALVPHPPNGEGEVTLVFHPDEWTEASWIADRIQDLHDAGARWRDVAVLCRTSRLFTLLQRALDERGAPVEVLGLAGLLKLPEVVEVLAYARAAIDPFASVALARILLGPRYRVGFKDLALVAGWAKQRNYAWRLRGEDDEESPFLFAEALEHLDEVEGVSEEGRARLLGFRDELRELRAEARRPVGEFLGEVIRRSGLLTELDADLDAERARAVRRNLAAFLDEVHAFEPVEGELTLHAFLDYVEAAEQLDKHEWAPVQPSDEDSVKVMTIHVAKGLEFDHVFVPGVARQILPDTRVQHNPAQKGSSLDFELRGDADILPRYAGVLSHFTEALRRQELIEERRTAYVALTRARKTLTVTGAHWYGDNVNAKGESEFFEELASWGEASGEATVERRGPAPEGNPMLGLRERFVREWPRPARRPGEADALFADGWRRAALAAAGRGGPEPSLLALEPAERAAFEAEASERRLLAAHLLEREGDEGRRGTAPLPTVVSASGVIDYARCPRRFYWSSVRPLPRFSGPAARIGTEVHRWIERRSSGQASLLELDEPPDLTVEELAGEPGKLERLRRAFLDSRFADMVPLYAERAFILSIGGYRIAGRIDAIYGSEDGPWEVVDWKTGRKPDADDPLAGMQLDVYGLACVEIWGRRPEDISLTYLYLAGGGEESRPMGDPAEVRAAVQRALEGIGGAAFDPTPGEHCRFCDFRPFCEAGRAWLATSSPA
jgi:DNA helicase-2/ATP-dependent DNA helicase PcrA